MCHTKTSAAEDLSASPEIWAVIRIAPDRLVFNTVTALQGKFFESIKPQQFCHFCTKVTTALTLMLTKPDIYHSPQVTKSYTYLSTTKNNVVNVFTALDNDVHRSKRGLIGQALTDRALKRFEPVMMDQINLYLGHIQDASRTATPVNMTETSRYLSLDIVGQLAFGYDLGVQKRDDNRYIMGAMYFGNYRGNIYHHLFFLSRLYVNKIFDYMFYQAREKYWRLVESMIQKRMGEDRHAKPDLYSFLADAMTADPDSLRGGALWMEALFFLAAGMSPLLHRWLTKKGYFPVLIESLPEVGGDTVATATSATFFYLAHNPACYETLAREIRSSFESQQDIQAGPRLSSCTYLRACIEEALRMSPPVSTTLWRQRDPGNNQPLIVDGHVIPHGTLFGVNAYALHHNEQYFPQAFTFRPERWLDSADNQEVRKVARAAFAAFSIGSRGCAGKSMAYLEVSLVIAKTLWSFDFERAPGDLGEVGGGKPGDVHGRDRPSEYQVHDIFTARHDGPCLVFKPRFD